MVKASDAYFLNVFNSKINYWEVIFLIPQKNGDVYANIVESKVLEGLKGLTKKEGDITALTSANDTEYSQFTQPELYAGKLDAKSFV